MGCVVVDHVHDSNTITAIRNKAKLNCAKNIPSDSFIRMPKELIQLRKRLFLAIGEIGTSVICTELQYVPGK